MIITGTGLINGTESKDRITGSDADDTILGLGGNDQIFAGAGDDLVEGGYGNDYIHGGGGVDTLFGGGGGDTLSGGSYFGGGGSGDQLFGGAGNDVLLGAGVDNLLDGGTGSDLVLFRPGKVFGDNLILGGDDGDTVRAEQNGKGELFINLGEGNDYLELRGTSRTTVTGGGGDDEIWMFDPKKLVAFGGEGDDRFEIPLPNLPGGMRVIKAGKGDDYVEVRGHDTWELLLGSGRDTVHYLRDTIYDPGLKPVDVLDFAAGAAGDAVDVVLLLMYSGVYWNGQGDAFAIGRLRLVQDGADTLVEADLDGVGTTYGWGTLVRLHDRDVEDFHADNFKGYDPDLQP